MVLISRKILYLDVFPLFPGRGRRLGTASLTLELTSAVHRPRTFSFFSFFGFFKEFFHNFFIFYLPCYSVPTPSIMLPSIGCLTSSRSLGLAVTVLLELAMPASSLYGRDGNPSSAIFAATDNVRGRFYGAPSVQQQGTPGTNAILGLA